MSLLLQLLLNGIVVGAIYGVFAVAFGVTFLVTRVFHVALAAVVAVAAYTYYQVDLSTHSAAIALLACVIPAVAAGVACEGLIYSPLRKRGADEMLILVGSLVVLTLVTSTIAIAWGHVPLPMPDLAQTGITSIAGLKISNRQFTVLGSAIAITAAVALFMLRTTQGRKMRAVSDNPELAAAMGIDVQHTYLWAFAVGSAAAALGAVLYASGRTVTPMVGLNPTLVAAVAVIFGGTGRPVPNFLTGVVFGIIESLALYNLSSVWNTSILFGILFLVLLFRPYGLFGTRQTALSH